MAQSEQKFIDSIASHLHACVNCTRIFGVKAFCRKKAFIDTPPQYPDADASDTLPQRRINVTVEKTAVPERMYATGSVPNDISSVPLKLNRKWHPLGWGNWKKIQFEALQLVCCVCLKALQAKTQFPCNLMLRKKKGEIRKGFATP